MNSFPVTFLQQANATLGLAEAPVRAHHAGTDNILLGAWRHPRLICSMLALSLAGAGGALLIMKRHYAAEAVVQLFFEPRDAGRPGDVASSVALDANALMQAELRVIRSRPVARGVAERLHLADEPAAAAPGLLGAAIAWAASVSAPAEQAWAELRGVAQRGSLAASPASDPAVQRLEDAADQVLGETTAESDNRSYLVTIKASTNDPVQAALVANAVAEEYIRRQIKAALESDAHKVEWLDSQLRQATSQLRTAEDADGAYRARSGLLELNSAETLDQQKLRDLSAQRAAAQLTLDAAGVRLARVQDSLQTGIVPSADDLKGLPQIGGLVERRTEARGKLNEVLSTNGPQHPRAIQAKAALATAEAALASELRRTVTVAQGDLAAAQRADADAQRRLDALQRSMVDGKGQETGLHSQQAAVQALRDRVAALTSSRNQAAALEQIRPPGAALIVPAEPPRAASSPKAAVVVPLALAGGLGLGILFAGMLERRDRGFRSGADIEPVLGKRCVGMVPELPLGLGQAATGLRARRTTFEASLLAETVRAAAAALGLFDQMRECRVVLVTSAVTREGKSVLCRVLADCLAASGRRVLLVDGSPFRNAPGAAEPGARDAFVTVARQPGLTVLRRNTDDSQANDVFGKAGFAHLIEEARKMFDIVVIEGPPVLLVADSIVLGRLSDVVVHAARWSATKQSVVAAALDRMQDSGVEVDGVILTRIDLARHAALNAADIGAHYLRERRFYEQLLPTPSNVNQSSARRAEPAREIQA